MLFLTSLMANPIVGAFTGDGQGIYDGIMDFIKPLVLLVIAVVAVTYLFKRQLTQFFQFLGLAILVGVLFYNPGIIEGISGWVASLFGA